MSKAANVLQRLRTDPTAACDSYGFAVERDVKAFPHYIGGRCKIEISNLNDNVYQLKAGTGTGDFFFPYTHIGGYAGRCQVPDNQPDGTMVITGGMNGCALQVNQENGYKMFYHDANGVQLSTETLTGNMVCRVGFSSQDPLNLLSIVSSRQNPYGFQTLITVKKNGRWLVVHTGILRSVSNKYSTFRSTVTPLLSSFDE